MQAGKAGGGGGVEHPLLGRYVHTHTETHSGGGAKKGGKKCAVMIKHLITHYRNETSTWAK